MRRYGLRIGSTALEFCCEEDRNKSLLCLTRGVTVRISERGLRYHDEGIASFGTYERDSAEVVATCDRRQGLFLTETCRERAYRVKLSYHDHMTEERGFICEACLALASLEADLFEARQKLEQAGRS